MRDVSRFVFLLFIFLFMPYNNALIYLIHGGGPGFDMFDWNTKNTVHFGELDLFELDESCVFACRPYTSFFLLFSCGPCTALRMYTARLCASARQYSGPQKGFFNVGLCAN